MRCMTCSKKSVITVPYNNTHYCAHCYERLLFKRVKRTIRDYCLMDLDKKHYLINKGTTPSLFLQEFYRNEFNIPRFSLSIVKRIPSRARNAVFVEPMTLTNASNAFVHSIFTGKKCFIKPVQKKGTNIIIRPLISTNNRDLSLWSNSRKKKPVFKIIYPDEDKFLDKVEERRVTTRFSILPFINKL